MLKIRFDLLICVTLTLLVYTLIQFIPAQYQGVPFLHHHRQHIFLSLNVFNGKKYGSIYKKMSPFSLLRSILWLLVSLFNSFHSLFSYFNFFLFVALCRCKFIFNHHSHIFGVVGRHKHPSSLPGIATFALPPHRINI